MPKILQKEKLESHDRTLRRESGANTNVPVKVIHGGPPPAVDVLVLITRAKQTHAQTRVRFEPRPCAPALPHVLVPDLGRRVRRVRGRS